MRVEMILFKAKILFQTIKSFNERMFNYIGEKVVSMLDY